MDWVILLNGLSNSSSRIGKQTARHGQCVAIQAVGTVPMEAYNITKSRIVCTRGKSLPCWGSGWRSHATLSRWCWVHVRLVSQRLWNKCWRALRYLICSLLLMMYLQVRKSCHYYNDALLSAHPTNPVVISFVTKTKKTLCASKGQRPLPLLDDGLWEATPLTAITQQTANPPVSDDDAGVKENLKNTALPVNPYPQYDGFSPSFQWYK